MATIPARRAPTTRSSSARGCPRTTATASRPTCATIPTTRPARAGPIAPPSSAMSAAPAPAAARPPGRRLHRLLQPDRQPGPRRAPPGRRDLLDDDPGGARGADAPDRRAGSRRRRSRAEPARLNPGAVEGAAAHPRQAGSSSAATVSSIQPPPSTRVALVEHRRLARRDAIFGRIEADHGARRRIAPAPASPASGP